MNQHPTSFASCLQKQKELEQLFQECRSHDEKYIKIIDLGRQLPLFPASQMTLENTVSGCQSTMYLYAYLEGHTGLMRFLAHSEALISAGLAALLIRVYDQESPETVLKCPALFLEKVGIQSLISPSRSNGLSSLFLKMKQQCLCHL